MTYPDSAQLHRALFNAFITEFEHTPEGRQRLLFDAWHAALTRYITGRLVPATRALIPIDSRELERHAPWSSDQTADAEFAAQRIEG